MLKNYLKIAIRNLIKHKIFSLVNILGLVAGLTCSFLIIVYVRYEDSYDSFNENADRIYRLDRELKTSGGAVREPLSCPPAAPALEKDLPGISNSVRFKNAGKTIVRFGDKQFYEDHVWYADASVFDIFTLPMVRGDPKTALTKPNTVVITQEMATKYLGDSDPIGKILKVDNENDFVVTGVIKNVPDNSHLEINMLFSFATLVAEKDPSLDNWLSFEDQTYVLLKNDIDYRDVNRQFPAFIDRYIGNRLKVQGKSIKFFLFPLTKIHLRSDLEGYPPGRITQVYFFMMFAVCIILIACLNFINLTTARSSSRGREVGVRKVVGAGRSQLMFQFLGETIILSLISFVCALVLVELTLPAFRTIIGQNLEFNLTKEPMLLMIFLGLAILVGIMAGSYPAIYLSRFQPLRVMRDEPGKTKTSLRSVLVLLQFFTSTVFIIQTLVLGYEIRYMRNMDLGFNQHDVVVLPIADADVRKSIQSLKKELKSCSTIIDVGSTSTLPGWNIPRGFEIPQGYTREQMQLMDVLDVDCGFIPTMDIKLADGRNFSDNFPADTIGGLLVNETAARMFGWSDPIGKTIRYNTGDGNFATGTVCGVVKDFHLASLYRVIEPLCISDRPEKLNYLMVRIAPANSERTLKYINSTWKEIYPDHPFEYSFLEQSFDRYFQVVEKILQICSYFTLVAIIIACLGIYALAAYTAERRTKEVGIRKVLGATTFKIFLKLNGEIMKLVAISIALGVVFMQLPLIDMHKFLPYSVKASFMVYLESALLVIMVAIATISYQSIKTATANPVEALRYE